MRIGTIVRLEPVIALLKEVHGALNSKGQLDAKLLELVGLYRGLPVEDLRLLRQLSSLRPIEPLIERYFETKSSGLQSIVNATIGELQAAVSTLTANLANLKKLSSALGILRRPPPGAAVLRFGLMDRSDPRNLDELLLQLNRWQRFFKAFGRLTGREPTYIAASRGSSFFEFLVENPDLLRLMGEALVATYALVARRRKRPADDELLESMAKAGAPQSAIDATRSAFEKAREEARAESTAELKRELERVAIAAAVEVSEEQVAESEYVEAERLLVVACTDLAETLGNGGTVSLVLPSGRPTVAWSEQLSTLSDIRDALTSAENSLVGPVLPQLALPEPAKADE